MTRQRRDLSPALLAAQRRLKLLQEKRQKERAACGQSHTAQVYGRSLQPDVSLSPSEYYSSLAASSIPDHLGWESAPITATLRAAYERREIAGGRGDWGRATEFVLGDGQQTLGQRPLATYEISSDDRSVKVYPDIAMGMLRQGQAAAGRIWLLLRHLDDSGGGWVSIDEARKRLTHKKADLTICGWRQLRNLLARGENIFWQRKNDRIWLRSVPKVAASLGVWRLQHQPVALPISVLKQRIGTVRAHFYASFHSGRGKERGSGKAQSRPIARDTIATITRVNPRTQRIYEKKANVQKQYNFALGEKATAEREQERAWRQGRALFRLTDHTGKQGKPGTTYLAWQLPNNYAGPHHRQSKGQQKHINRKLTDLFMQGITGNEQWTVKGSDVRHPRRFYDNGRSAAKAYNSDNRDIYWRSCRQPDKRSLHQLWYFLPELPK